MSHEEVRAARRSASQGALNGSYAVQTRANSIISSAGHHPVPSFKPLRSIREHGHTFLDPAASADGMLRKTTETGNIGLFSINTGRPSPLRPRASLGDLRQPHRPFSRSSDKPPGHDDRKRLPSYRDSTSEIISMYGSDNQSSSKSISGTLSPPWDDSGQRSYSMTTCGSKSYTLPRNNDFRLAHDFQVGVQRPRSPYPYPTRLPRPGIRPSSPALTENGMVDYSRMVEIDRIPQRTIHHPHKTLFPYKTTRAEPGPLSMRYGVNQSTRSLSDDHSPARPFPFPMSRRPPLPNHLHPWGLRPRDRLGNGSSEQSLRTVSLSSTSGTYECAPPQVPSLQVPEKKPPIFYDYSEDFEDAIDPPPDFPIANPMPTRISKSFRSSIPDGGCDDRSESADEGVGHVLEYLRRVTTVESGEDQDGIDEDHGLEHDRSGLQLYQRESPSVPSAYEPVEGALAPSPLLPRFVNTVASSNASIATLEDHQSAERVWQTHDSDHVMEPLENDLVTKSSTVGSHLNPEAPSLDVKTPLAEAACHDNKSFDSPNQHKKSIEDYGNGPRDEILELRRELTELTAPVARKHDLASSASATLPCRYSNGRNDSRLFSLSSGLSDLASFVKYVDKHMQALDRDDIEQHGITVPDSRSESNSDHGRRCNQTVQESPALPRTSSLAHQRRSHVERKINTPAPVDELERYQVVSTRSGPTLVPQPISPAKMLRVKNSISQLMKALPPLPGYSPASESPFNPTIVPVEFEPFEFSRLTDARSTLIEPFGSKSHSEKASEGYDPFIFDRRVRKPKLKLKNAPSLGSSNLRRLRPANFGQAEMDLSETPETRPSTTGGEYPTAAVKRRLPIKVSRSALSSVASEDSGTVKRRPGLDKSSAVSELASSQPVDLFSTSKTLEIAVLNAGPSASEPANPSNKRGSLLLSNAPPAAKIRQVTVVDEGRGVSLDTHLNALHLPRAKNEAATEDEMQSFFSDSLVKPRRGLRKKLSNLKSRLIESRHHHFSSAVNAVVREDNFDKATQPDTEAHAPNVTKSLLTEMSATTDHHTVTPTRTVKSTLEKLVKGVKCRLRTLGKNKHKDE